MVSSHTPDIQIIGDPRNMCHPTVADIVAWRRVGLYGEAETPAPWEKLYMINGDVLQLLK